MLWPYNLHYSLSYFLVWKHQRIPILIAIIIAELSVFALDDPYLLQVRPAQTPAKLAIFFAPPSQQVIHLAQHLTSL